MAGEFIDFSKLVDDFGQLEEQSREEYRRVAFSFPGSKHKSLANILPNLDYRKRFIETCGGSGVVTMNRKPSELEVFNDRYAGITVFFRCVREHDKMVKLVARLKQFLHSREEFIWCASTWENPEDEVERAARWYYMVRTSFSQIGRNWGRGINSPAMIGPKFYRGLKLIPPMHERFRDIQIENIDAIQCVIDYDSEDSVFYHDPDYQDTDAGIYKHSVNHKLLLDTIFRSKGFHAVSGYPNELYDSYPWSQRKSWKVRVTSQSKAKTETNHLIGKDMMDGNLKAEEVLWIKE